YFSQIQSALSIPNASARLERLVRKHLPSLMEATRETLPPTIQYNPPVRADLQAFDLDQVWSVLDAVRRNETPLPPPLKVAEYAYVQDVPFEKPGDTPTDEEREAHFFARRCSYKDGLPDGIERIVL